MFKKFTLIFLSMLGLWLTCLYSLSADNRGYITNVRDIVPELDFEMLDGTKVSLSELKGKVVVLQFTASWSSASRKEMPHLENEVWILNKDKDFIVIGIDIDEDSEKVNSFIEKMTITYPIAFDTNTTHFYNFASKKADATSIEIDKMGKIAFQTRLLDRVEFEEMKV